MRSSENPLSRPLLGFSQARALLLVSIGSLLSAWLVWPTLGKAQSPEAATPAAASASVPSEPSSELLLETLTNSFEYDPRGRRDPFVQSVDDRPVAPGAVHGPLLPLQKYDLNQLELVGVIWDVRKPKAMVRDPKGETHIVGPNTRLGTRNGYIAVIREGEIVVVETVDQEGRLLSTAQVVKIKK